MENMRRMEGMHTKNIIIDKQQFVEPLYEASKWTEE